MTTLRNLNRAVQSAEFPSHEWAQAVREMLNEIAERMEPASEGAKVECPNCGQPGEHYHSGDMPHVPAFYTCQPAQPEPAAPVGEMFPAMRAFLDASPVQRTIGQWHAADNELKAAHAAPPKVAMSPDLEDLLDSIMSFADVDPDTQVKQIWRRKVAAVRAQRKP